MDEYLIPTGGGEAELIEKKSRFLGHIFRVASEEEALSHIKEMRDRYWDASHNVYAYRLKSGPARYSDDGEPGGTAGMPVLDTLQKGGVYDVCCVVTRYFGGTLLGTGGLVRAYGKTAKLALEAAGLSKMQVWRPMEIPCPYPLYEQLRREVAALGGQIAASDFGAEVRLEVLFPEAAAEPFLLRLRELSGGRVTAEEGEPVYRDFPVGEG